MSPFSFLFPVFAFKTLHLYLKFFIHTDPLLITLHLYITLIIAPYIHTCRFISLHITDSSHVETDRAMHSSLASAGLGCSPLLLLLLLLLLLVVHYIALPRNGWVSLHNLRLHVLSDFFSRGFDDSGELVFLCF